MFVLYNRYHHRTILEEQMSHRLGGAYGPNSTIARYMRHEPIWSLRYHILNGSMHLYGIYLGLELVLMSLLWGPCMYYIGTWTHWDTTLARPCPAVQVLQIACWRWGPRMDPCRRADGQKPGGSKHHQRP